MDGGVQLGYEHAVPKATQKLVAKTGGRRVVAIMREGTKQKCPPDADNGVLVASLDPPERWDFEANGGRFGHIAGVVEGVSPNGVLDPAALYSRERLVETG